MATFALDLAKFADKVKGRADAVVGDVVSQIVQVIDNRSPVGSPLRWKHPAPKGYVGGRFRGNWQLGIGSPPAGALERIDPSGLGTVSAALSAIPAEAAGRVYYYVNNLPYAQRIEEGWSSIAPSGLVGLTAIEFPQMVDQAVAANGGGA